MSCRISQLKKIITVTKTGKNCNFNFKKDDQFELKQIIPPGICIDFLHKILPYISAAQNNAKFRNGLTNYINVRCPYGINGTIAQIEVNNSNPNDISIKIISKDEECSMEISVDSKWTSEDFSSYFCPSALFTILTFAKGNNSLLVSCSNCETNNFFLIENNKDLK